MPTPSTRPEAMVLAALLALLLAGCQAADRTPPDDAVSARIAAAIQTPDQAVDALRAGNARFLARRQSGRDLLAQVQATAGGQQPFAAVLGCIDSRVAPEIVFDQGIGKIFAARIAGNFADTDMLGSLEFATKLAGARAIVVLGHTECGAIKGACDGAQLGNLTATLAHLAPAVEAVTDVEGERDSKNRAFVQAVADQNVRLTVEALTARSEVMAELVKSGQLVIVGAMYDVGTGEVEFR